MASDTSDDASGGAAGTFWSTLAALSPLETLLQQPDCSVKALLDEDDIIQEFKGGNERLISRLCTVDACMTLVEFITQNPSEEDRQGLNLEDHAPTECTVQAPHVHCLRYPFISVEIMTCPQGPGNAQLLQFFVNSGDDALLSKLWSFLEASEADDINPVLAGYFQRAVAAILSRHSLEMVTYLRKRGADALLEKFLERLHLRSLAELFARLLCVENSAQLLFPVDGLVLRLLRRLEDPGVTDIQENISLIVQELLAHKESLCYSEELMIQLTEPAAVRLLVDHIFSGRAACTSASIAILNSVLHNSYMASVAASGAGTPGTNAGALSPMSPPLLALNDDDVVNFAADELDTETSEGVPPSSPSAAPRSNSPDCGSPPLSPANSHSGAPGTPNVAEARSTALIREVGSHLPRIRTYLCTSLEQTKNVGLPGVGTVPSVGITILEVLSLLTTLVRTGSTEICEVLLAQELLPRCLEIFFRHPWSSLLQNAVRGLLSEIMSSFDRSRSALIISLLREGALLERITAEYAEEERYRAGGRKKHPRVGYMGILHNMCVEIRDYGARINEIGTLLASTSGWNDTVLPAVSATIRIHQADLGGGVPSEDRNLASSSTTMGSVSGHGADSTAADDFVLDDIQDDIDEEGFKSERPPGDFDEVLVDSGGRENGNAAYLDSDFDPDSASGGSSSVESAREAVNDMWEASFPPSSGEGQLSPDSPGELEKNEASAATAPGFGAFDSFESQTTSDQAAAPLADAWQASFTEMQPQTEEWAAFDSAFAPSTTPASEEQASPAQPDNTVTKEDLFNLLAAPSTIEKKVEAPMAQATPPPQWLAQPTQPAQPAQTPVMSQAPFQLWGGPPLSGTPTTAVPSSMAPMTGVVPTHTKAPADDSMWTADFSSPEAKYPDSTSATSLTGMGNVTDPWAMTAPAAPSTAQVGAENLFALLEQDAGAAARPAAEVQPSSFTAAPVTGLPDVATPWPLDSFPALSSASPASAVGTEDPFATLMSPKSASNVPHQSQAPLSTSPTGAANADRSWVADFDPLQN